jgi:glutathione S-transferase
MRFVLLLPSADSAASRAAVRLFVNQLDFKPFYGFLMDPSPAAHDTHVAACVAALAAIESRYASACASSPFFLGAALSAADVALLPFVDRFIASLGAYRGWDLLAAAGAGRVGAALAAARERPAWRATAQPHAFYVAAYSGYAAGKATVTRRVPVAAAS